MSTLVDARGRSCPEPVMMTKEALDNKNEKEIDVMVDSQTALDNVIRYGEKEGCSVSSKQDNDEFIITIKR